MNLSEHGFMILRDSVPGFSPEGSQPIAKRLSLSEREVEEELTQLEEAGLLFKGRTTKAGERALAPYRVKNAIILAAGFRESFVPLSYEKPACLLSFKGEILVERLIRQLKAAGIHKIIVVAGDKAEQMFYLEKKYGVEVVFNPEYLTRGSHASLMTVRTRLRRTYIIDSCDYYPENPFHRYERRAFCSLGYAKGRTERYCVTIDRGHHITKMTPGGADCWCLKGNAFFDEAVSEAFRNYLMSSYVKPQTSQKSWLDLVAECLEDLALTGLVRDGGFVTSLESLSQAAGIDPEFMNSGRSDIFANIVQVLNCSRSEIRDIYLLDHGLTNFCFHFAIDAGEWIYRHPGIGNDKLVDYAAEVEAQEVAKKIGLCTTSMHEDPEEGWMIARFSPDVKRLDPHDGDSLERIMQTIRKLHDAPGAVSRVFDYYDVGRRFSQMLMDVSTMYMPAFSKLAAMASRAREIARIDEGDLVLCHNALSDATMIQDGADITLTEWDYAGMSDYASDFGSLVATCQLSEQEALQALECYFGRPPSEREICHNFAYVGLASWCWYVWSLLKEAQGDYVGDWLFVYHSYAKEYLAKAAWIAEAIGLE